MRICGNSITFEDYPVEEACQRLAASGCNAVEMWKQHLAACKTPTLMAHFREFAAELGLELWGLNVVGADYFAPFGSGKNYDRTLAGLKEDVDYAIDLGVQDVMVWEGLRPEDDRPDADLLAVLVSLFGEAIDYARPKRRALHRRASSFHAGYGQSVHETALRCTGSRKFWRTL